MKTLALIIDGIRSIWLSGAHWVWLHQPTIRHEVRLCLYEKHKTEGALPRSEGWFPAAIFSVLEVFVDCFRFGSPTVSGPVPVAAVCSEAHSSIADVFEPILAIPRGSLHTIWS